MVAFLVSRSAKTDIADSVSWCISLTIFTHFDCFLLMICWRTGNSMKHSTAPPVPIFWSHHISTSSVIYCWRDTRQHGVYLVIVMAWHNCTTHHFCKARVSVGMQSTQSLCSILSSTKILFPDLFFVKKFLFDKLNFARILISSYLWYIGGQTQKWCHYQRHFLFFFFLFVLTKFFTSVNLQTQGILESICLLEST